MRLALVALCPVLALLCCGVAFPHDAHAHGLLVAASPDAPTPAPTGGAQGPVVLQGHRVEAVIHGPVADVEVEQVFRNQSDRRLEGTYLFPLPEGAAVARFAMTMGGRMVEGEIVEAREARRIYESIVRRRRDPGLLEYVGRGLFRAQVFPIEPRSDLTIRLTFQQVVPEDGGTLEFRYPLATSRLHGEPVAETVLSVEVRSDVDVKAVYSPSHDVEVVRRGNREVVASYERSGTRQERDFLLYVGRSEEDVGFSLLSHKQPGEHGTFLAVLAPSTEIPDGARLPKDVVYVLDTSGSMEKDDKIEQAKRALEYGIRVLGPDDRFNVVSFSAEIRPFREGPVPATAEMKDAAAAWIAGLRAHGGTNIRGALRAALGDGTPGRLSLVVFLTDGRPTVGERKPEALLRFVKQENHAGARIFTFGLGFDLDVHLLDRIAEATGGARDYVMPREELELVTSRFFRKVNQPVMSDVRIEFGEGVHSVYPKAIGDLFAGGQVTVMGRYARGGDRTIRLSGTLGGETIVHAYAATLRDTAGPAFLPRLWAHRKVAYLLDEIRLHGHDDELVDEVIRLATVHGIVTPYTSGLVVEERELEGVPPPTTPGAGGGGSVPLRGSRSRWRGPNDRVPPGVREPADPTAPPPPPPSGPPATPSPTTPSSGPASAGHGGFHRGPSGAVPPEDSVRQSERLRDGKDADRVEDGARVRSVGPRVFLLKGERWVDTAWDEVKETVKIEAFSDAWLRLMEEGEEVAKILALGDRIVFVWGETVYEVVPPAGEEEGR
ncbi:MAG: VIT and vWA domain-containing protein [Planctomycetota bacterium]|jgi:Ca-activated chloride channel family protein